MEMEKYLRLIMIYPKIGLNKGTKGVVDVEFAINREGRVDRPVILKGLGENFDNEVIRMVEAMPRWTPQEQNGYIMETKFLLPVEFKWKEF